MSVCFNVCVCTVLSDASMFVYIRTYVPCGAHYPCFSPDSELCKIKGERRFFFVVFISERLLGHFPSPAVRREAANETSELLCFGVK